MTTTPQINFANIDFATLKNELITYITAESEFNEQNREGSNFNLMVSLLAYITNILSYNLNQSINEHYLPTVELRENVLKIVEFLNYTPLKAVSSSVIVDMSAIVKSATPGNLLMYDKIKGGNLNWYYTGYINEVYVGQKLITTTSLSYVKFVEGTLVSSESAYIGTGNNFQEFSIAETNIGDHFRIFTYNDTNPLLIVRTYWEEYNPATIYEDPINAMIYFVKETETGYKIKFGNNLVGRVVASNEKIGYEYIKPTGTTGNNITAFTWDGGGRTEDINQDAPAYTDGTITSATIALNSSNTASTGYSPKETIDEIKFNAPKFFQSGGVATTEDGYKAVAIRHPWIDSAVVIGGEKLTPPMRGKVYITAKPDLEKIGSATFSTSQLSTLRDYFLLYSVVSINPVVENPELIHLIITSILRYSGDTAPYIPTVTTSIYNYVNVSNSNFEEYFECSKLRTNIDDSDAVITSNITTVEKFYNITSSNYANTDAYGTPIEDGVYNLTLTKNLDSAFVTRIKQYNGTTLVRTYVEDVDFTVSYTSATAGTLTITFLTGDLGLSDSGSSLYTNKFFFDTTDDDMFLNTKQILTIATADIVLSTEKVE